MTFPSPARPCLAFALALFVLGSISESPAADQPNILFILADDMGSGDVGALNPDSTIPTPALDGLAAAGMTFTDAHSPSAVCTPTRYATLTGQYPWRSAKKRGVLNGYGAPFWRGELTVAAFLQEHGYATSVVGKWHLGLGFQKDEDGAWDWEKPVTHSPNDVGFDKSYVIPASLDFPPYIYIEDNDITEVPTEAVEASGFPDYWRAGERAPGFDFLGCLDHIVERASGEIARLAADEDKPFLLYVPLTSPHKPASPHPRYVGKSGLGTYGDFVIQTDEAVGSILGALDASGAADNTVVFYTSDNGSYMYRLTDADGADHVEDSTVQGFHQDHHRSNGNLRGTKADIWEAGHRVPFFVRWPGTVEPGSTCDETVTHTDFFATAAQIAGLKIPAATEAAADSFSLLGFLQNRPGAKRGAPVIHHSGGGMFAIRDGDWKLVLGDGSGGRQVPKGTRFQHPYQLFNLSDDLGETTDLIDQFPERAEALERKAIELMIGETSR